MECAPAVDGFAFVLDVQRLQDADVHVSQPLGYPLAMTDIAIENGYRNSEFSQ